MILSYFYFTKTVIPPGYYLLNQYYTLLFVDDKKIFEDKPFSGMSAQNFQQFTPKCNITSVTPSKDCGHIFKIKLAQNTTSLFTRQDYNGEKDYCLNVHEDKTYSASVCKKEESNEQER